MDNEHEEGAVAATPEPPETVESIQAQIDELSKKLVAANEAELEEQKLELIEVPVADGEVFVTKGHSVLKHGMTPAEVLILSAMHHAAVGDVPVKSIKPTGTVKVDPLQLRQRLAGRYGAERVMKCFPGMEPKFPKTFSRALLVGVGTILPSRNMMDHQLSP